ncbi:hypothetical protein MMC29_005102 [Sticta canariensis]|nr:hypothetical protein [Sticta canariensis]
MSPNDSAGRIHRVPFLAACTTLFAISLLFVITRTVLRLHYQKRLFIDDAFLFFAVLCLCAAMVLLYVSLEMMYMAEAYIITPHSADIAGLECQISRLHKITIAFIILTYTAICAVKFSFLFFLRILVRRIPRMLIFWRVVVVITCVVWVTGSIGAVVRCPYYDLRSTKSCVEKSGISKVLGLGALLMILDIATDMLIMMIPIYLLWHIQITLRQKIVVGAFFCLSIMMILTAVIRVVGIHSSRDKDNHNWQIFWQVAEACIAVSMVSLSAFRSFFVAHESRSREPRHRPWYMSRINVVEDLRKMRLGIESDDMKSLPYIPRATLTGMRTVIRGQTRGADITMRTEQSRKDNDIYPTSHEENPEDIKMDYSISVRTDETPENVSEPQGRNSV